jgi:hypothetical protein
LISCEKANAQLSPEFDIKAFHDEILSGGAMPLNLLQERGERRIRGQGPSGELRLAMPLDPPIELRYGR